MATQSRPTGVGIKAIELYIPNKYIAQSELESHDKVSAGKYEIGLGQIQMGFCDDREDIYSFCLTAVSQLLEKYDISPTSIGRLEVGTETLLDKSKSVKSVLMQLFTPSGNTDIEGVDTLNACYGGTNALFNAIHWIESSSWDGRDAIVVAGDIAIYDKGPARPTGGAGVIAMLVGPNAPLMVEPGRRGSFMQHTYDFYKPNMSSEYPVVDGHYSIECFFRALDGCYKAYSSRSKKVDNNSQTNGFKTNGFGSNGVNDTEKDNHWKKNHNSQVNGHLSNGTNGFKSSALSEFDKFDFMCFHTPNCKLAQKSYARLLYNDFLLRPHDKRFDDIPLSILEIPAEKSYGDKSIEKVFMVLAADLYRERSQPSTLAASLCGNMYTASLYGALASLISTVPDAEIMGKRIAMFSYGSGLASSLTSIRVSGDLEPMRKVLNLQARLKARHHQSPLSYEKALYLRENAYSKSDFTPAGDIEELVKGTYYLTHVDEKFRRFYQIKE